MLQHPLAYKVTHGSQCSSLHYNPWFRDYVVSSISVQYAAYGCIRRSEHLFCRRTLHSHTPETQVMSFCRAVAVSGTLEKLKGPLDPRELERLPASGAITQRRSDASSSAAAGAVSSTTQRGWYGNIDAGAVLYDPAVNRRRGCHGASGACL